MNLNNINKLDLKIMCYRVDDVRESLLKDKTVFDRYSPRYNYLYKVVMRLIRQIHKINSDYTLCAYCLNGLNHNYNDHELAVERQRVTNELYDFDFNSLKEK